MARASITLEDLPDGTLRLCLDSDPPLSSPFTPAQTFIIAMHEHLNRRETGAPITEFVPVCADLGEGNIQVFPHPHG